MGCIATNGHVHTIKQFRSIYQDGWIVDPFALKFYSLTQNNINATFDDGWAEFRYVNTFYIPRRFKTPPKKENRF